MDRKRRILIAPLNWGLGHASRCIPVIERFLAHSAEVVLAADGRPYDFLKNEFPALELHRLRDIAISYADNSSMAMTIVRQAPHLVSSFMNERRAVDAMIDALGIGGIVSDNRFGLYTKKIPCVYMTHQISIMTPSSLAWLSPALRSAHAALMDRYTECWIPDSAGDVNLSGALSHGMRLPRHAHYIGPLSRLHPDNAPVRYDCAVVLSGPEPQRTIFESIVLRQLERSKLRAIVVQGKPEQAAKITHEEGRTGADGGTDGHARTETRIEIVPSLNARELNNVMNASACIVARSGYSTIMDLASLGKRAVLVPTPGQTEQEYIARRLMDKNIFYSETQSEFDLERALGRSSAYSGWTAGMHDTHALDARIEHFLSMIPI